MDVGFQCERGGLTEDRNYSVRRQGTWQQCECLGKRDDVDRLQRDIGALGQGAEEMHRQVGAWVWVGEYGGLKGCWNVTIH